jgi:hypothetical protein
MASAPGDCDPSRLAHVTGLIIDKVLSLRTPPPLGPHVNADTPILVHTKGRDPFARSLELVEFCELIYGLEEALDIELFDLETQLAGLSVSQLAALCVSQEGSRGLGPATTTPIAPVSGNVV